MQIVYLYYARREGHFNIFHVIFNVCKYKEGVWFGLLFPCYDCGFALIISRLYMHCMYVHAPYTVTVTSIELQI
jgi:hypothetical protein